MVGLLCNREHLSPCLHALQSTSTRHFILLGSGLLFRIPVFFTAYACCDPTQLHALARDGISGKAHQVLETLR